MTDGMDDAIKEIGDALYRLRHAFDKHKLPVPDVLEWSSPEQGRKVEILLREHMHATGQYIMDASAGTARQATLHGFTVRYGATPFEDFNPDAYAIYNP